MIGGNSTAILIYGDDFNDTFKMSESIYHCFNHSYSTTGNYTVQAIFKTFNNNSLLFNLTKNVIVQNAIESLKIIGSKIFTFIKQVYKFELEMNSHSIGATDVFCSWNLSTNFALTEIRFIPEFSFEKRAELLYNFSRRNVGKNIHLDVFCWNLVSKITARHNFTIMEKISNITLKISSLKVEPFEPINLNLTTLSGSHITFLIDFNDTTKTEIEHPFPVESEKAITLWKIYNDTGNYILTIDAFNKISKVHLKVIIVVQIRIKNLSIITNNKIYWPPGNLTYSIKLDRKQNILKDISCDIVFNNGLSKFIFIKEWSYDNILNFTQILPKSALGLVEIRINCSNDISEAVDSKIINYRLDLVIIDAIKIVQPVLVFNLTTFVLEMDNLGDRGCLHIQFGNKLDERTFGLDELCENYSKDKLINFTKISKSDKEIRFHYRYEAEGVYYVTIRAFNHLGSDFIFEKVTVKNWYCFPPKINLNDYYLQNFKIYKIDILELNPNITISCSKTNIINFHWSLINLNTNETIQESFNETLMIQKYSLNYGYYQAFLVVKMDGMEEMASNTTIYFEIVKLPLNVSLEGRSTITAYYPDNVTFRALVKSDNTKEIRFTWFCKLINEKDNETNELMNLNNPPNLTMIDYEKNGGCFGTGPGKLFINSSSFVLNTKFLNTNYIYIIRVRVTSPTSTVEAEQELIIHNYNPVINVT